MSFAGVEDRNAIEAEMPWADRDVPKTLWSMLSETAGKFPSHDAISYQIFSGPKDHAETLSWSQLRGQVGRAANLFRSLGVGPTDVVAYVLPNCNETVITLLGGAVAGIANPINPLLEAEQIGSILRETNAKVVVTLRPFPKTDVAEKTAEAVKLAPNVTTVLEVDLCRYLTAPKSWIVPLIRPKLKVTNQATYKNFNSEIAKQSAELTFDDPQEDRVAFYFHTGGTTGMPKVAQHKYSGMVYNGWLGHTLLYTENDNIMCPLPLFHVFACHVILMAAVKSGAHVVFPTPQGYRGDGVFDNFWKLVERWKITFIITVPTAISAKMQRPINADISTVKTAFSGSAPLPLELFRRFEKATGITLIEGYGLTEATCLVSSNPTDGVRKVGSIGITFPYTDVKIVKSTSDGLVEAEVDDFLSDCIMSARIIICRVFLSGDELLGVEELAVGAGADLVDDGGLEVEHDAAGDVLAGAGLREECIVGIIFDPDGLVGGHGAVRLDTVLQAEKLPAGVTNLDTSLTNVNRDDFTHDEKECVFLVVLNCLKSGLCFARKQDWICFFFFFFFFFFFI